MTAAETSSLDEGLRRLPATVRRGRSTMASLRRTATAARPLAVELRDGAPQLATAVQRAPGFLGDLRSFLVRARPTLQLTHRLLRAAGPTIEAGPTRVVTGAFDLAPAISNLLRGVLGEDETIEVLFNEKFGLGAASAEPGNQPGYPAEHADRRFMRVTAILNCEAFGAEIQPGCLVDLLGLARARAARAGEAGDRRARTRDHARGGAGGAAPDAARPKAPAPAPTAGSPAPAPASPAPTAPAPPTGPAPASPAPSGQTIQSLLDYLLK